MRTSFAKATDFRRKMRDLLGKSLRKAVRGVFPHFELVNQGPQCVKIVLRRGEQVVVTDFLLKSFELCSKTGHVLGLMVERGAVLLERGGLTLHGLGKLPMVASNLSGEAVRDVGIATGSIDLLRQIGGRSFGGALQPGDLLGQHVVLMEEGGELIISVELFDPLFNQRTNGPNAGRGLGTAFVSGLGHWIPPCLR